MRFLRRGGNGHKLTIFDDIRKPPERRPWVVFRGVLLHDWCEAKGDDDA